MSAWPKVTGHVLAVVAHPDDESFGLGALLATIVSGGGTVDVVCFTAGEASTLGAGPALGAVRARELRDAADVLGIRDIRLEGFPDGGLAGVPPARLDEALRRARRDVDAVVVFEASGVTGHPDHRAATAAGVRLAATTGADVLEWGVPPTVAAALNAEFGTSFAGLAGPGSALIHVDRSAQRRAIACHRSQATDNPVLRRRLELSGDRDVIRFAPASTRARRQVPQAGGASWATPSPSTI